MNGDGQSKAVSLIEATVNTSIGFVVSMIAWQAFVAPLFGYHVTLETNLQLTAIFTVLSILRSYVVRRFFARGLHLFAVRLVQALGGKRT